MSEKYIDIPDEELVKGCSTHEEKYFSMIYHKYYSKMYYVCKRYTSNREEAEDLVQEGFIKVYKQLNKYGFKGSFEGWIRRIMINNSINYLKKKAQLNFIESIEKPETLSDSFSVPVEEIKEHIPASILMKFIEELPAAYKIIFNLYAIDKYSHIEIAKMLNIKESTSRANLTKARLKLKKCVEDVLIKERGNYA